MVMYVSWVLMIDIDGNVGKLSIDGNVGKLNIGGR